MTSAETTTSRGRPIFVIRPGRFQLVAWAALELVIGGFLLWTGGWRVLLAIAGALLWVYLLSLRVDLTADAVTKSYLFGLRRRAVSRDRLTSKEYSVKDAAGVSIWEFVDFRANDGAGFALLLFWVWSADDVDALWDQIHPRPSVLEGSP